MENPYFTVEESGLNWLEINHVKKQGSLRVRVWVDGNGIVTVREGKSPLVGNDFATDVKDPKWADVREYRLNIPRENVVPIFQMLVDHGLFEKQDKDAKGSEDELVMARANIQHKTISSAISDPELAEYLKNVVMMFYHPSPVRKR